MAMSREEADRQDQEVVDQVRLMNTQAAQVRLLSTLKAHELVDQFQHLMYMSRKYRTEENNLDHPDVLEGQLRSMLDYAKPDRLKGRESKVLSKKDHEFCSAAKTDYEKACYNQSKLAEIPEMDPELIKNAIHVTRILHAYIEQCVLECHQDRVCECLDLCNQTRKYIRRCVARRYEYVRHCSSNEDTHTRRETMADNFAILLFKELRTEYDERLSELCEGVFKLNGYSFNPTKEYFTNLPALEDENGVDDSGSVMNKAGYILGRIQSHKRPALYRFLKSVHGMSTITFNDDGEVDWVDWEFATVILGSKPNAMHLSIQNYHDLVVACKFDRTVFAKVVKLIKFMHVNSLAFDDDGTEKTQFVTLKWNFLMQTLKALGKHKSVWSFIRLPSSTSVLIQILLSDSLLNTSFMRNKFTFKKAEMVDTLAYALTTPRVVNAFNQRPDIAELTSKYIRQPRTVTTGLRPTWLVEVITRGDYGKVLLALKNEIDARLTQASASLRGSSDRVHNVLSHYSGALDNQHPFKESAYGVPLAEQLNALEKRGKPKSPGDTVFELNSTSNESKLIRGDYEITSSGQLKITTDEDIDKGTWNKIYLPIDETRVVDTFDAFEEVRECLFKMIPSCGRSIGFYVNNDIFFSRSARELPVETVGLVHDLGFGHRHTWSYVQDILWAKW